VRFLPIISLLFGLSLPAPALERLNPPAFLKGNPGLYADFNFLRGENHKTLVELALGGKFSDIKLGPKAGRPPRFSVTCEFQPKYKIAQEPQARGGEVDLAKVLQDHHTPFTPAAFGPGARLCFNASVYLELVPAEYLVTILLEDSALGLRTEKTLRVTVPSPELPQWSLGDLRFCLSPGKPEALKRLQTDTNPFRQVGKKAGIPLKVSYEILQPPTDWTGNTVVHHFYITRMGKKQRLVWESKEARPLIRNGSLEVFEMPYKKLNALNKGRHLLHVEIEPEQGQGSRRHAYKSFEVVN
jgi:hypothetical protein